MAVDRDPQLLAQVRVLEQQDADLALRIDAVVGLLAGVDAIRAGSRRVLNALAALPAAAAVAAQSVSEALTREELASAERDAAERRLEDVSGRRRASEEAMAEARRAVDRATVAAADAADTVLRMRE